MEVAEESSDSEYNSMTSSNIPYDDDTVISDDKDTDCDVLTSNLDDVAEGLAQTQWRKPVRRWTNFELPV